MRRLLTNQRQSYVRLYDYPLRKAVVTGEDTRASVLFVHATGFHGRVFDKTLSFLSPETYSCYTFDQRGHGLSPWPDDAPVTQLEDWDGFGEDALDVVRYVQQQHPPSRQRLGGVVGVGHSQGATALLLAALQEPQRFSGLILYEPVVFPKLWQNLSKAFFRFSESPLALASRRRRLEFDTLNDAFLNFAAKRPMNAFHIDVLRDYVRFGTKHVKTPGETRESADGGKLRLCCDPNIEAMIYNSVHLHNTWDRLSEVTVPVWVVSGRVDRFDVSGVAKKIHEQIPQSTYVLWEDCSHFGPLERPSKLSDLVEEVVLRLSLAAEN